MTQQFFMSAGKEHSEIDVRLSYHIIKLFSEGLYSSPNKAVEELVSNAFDAEAKNVHVVLSASLDHPDATIVVIDDGEGMDDAGFRRHWLIGRSEKRERGTKSRRTQRLPIGKFGIGKLATYVLASRLSHISKTPSGYFAASMDFSRISSMDRDADASEDNVVHIPLRRLTEEEAREATSLWNSSKPGFSAIPLFGAEAPESWTVAIMSDLKPMAIEISMGRLKWVLATGMPLGNDFKLFLNGERVESSKLKQRRVNTWILGKHLTKLTGIDDLEAVEDLNVTKGSEHRHGLNHKDLGRITGYAEAFEDLLTQGKAAERGRSHGFFVYVRGRLINADDEYFGINSNKLWHGAFSRFRLTVHIDKLDDELRSHRESVRQTGLLETAKAVLQAIFNVARSELANRDKENQGGANAAKRANESPESLTRQPLAALVKRAVKGECRPKLIKHPLELSEEEVNGLLGVIEHRSKSADGLIGAVSLTSLSQNDRLAMFDM